MSKATELVNQTKIDRLYKTLVEAYHTKNYDELKRQGDEIASLSDEETVALACRRSVLPEFNKPPLSGMQLGMLLTMSQVLISLAGLVSYQ